MASPGLLQLEIEEMCKSHAALLLLWAAIANTAYSAQPLELVQTIEMPAVAEGAYSDHLALDLRGHRIFASEQESKAVVVSDLNTGKVLHTIPGLDDPHTILYRRATDQILIVDGGLGAVNVYAGSDYKLLKTIKLRVAADGSAYDAARKLLYVANGGIEANEKHARISIVDTATDSVTGNIRIDANQLEAIVLDPTSSRLYVNLPMKHRIAVLDRDSRTILAEWNVPNCRTNVAAALDVPHKLLYVACRNTAVLGSIVTLDTITGKKITVLPAPSWIDDIAYDARRGRIYASSGLAMVLTYQRLPDGRYRELQRVDTAIMAKTSLYSPELDRLFVSVPRLGFSFDRAKILVFRPTN